MELQTDIDFISALLPKFADALSGDPIITTDHFMECPDAWNDIMWSREDIDIWALFSQRNKLITEDKSMWNFQFNSNITEEIIEMMIQEGIKIKVCNARNLSLAFIEKHLEQLKETGVERFSNITYEDVERLELCIHRFMWNPNITIEVVGKILENGYTFLGQFTLPTQQLLAAFPERADELMHRRDFPWTGREAPCGEVALHAPFWVIERLAGLMEFSSDLVRNKNMRGHLTREHYEIAARNPNSANYLPLEFLTDDHSDRLSFHSQLSIEELYGRLDPGSFKYCSDREDFTFDHINRFPDDAFCHFAMADNESLVWNEFLRKEHTGPEQRMIANIKKNNLKVWFRDPYGRFVYAPLDYLEALRLRVANIRRWLTHAYFALSGALCEDAARLILAFCIFSEE